MQANAEGRKNLSEDFITAFLFPQTSVKKKAALFPVDSLFFSENCCHGCQLRTL
jgi:hypothetical protein